MMNFNLTSKANEHALARSKRKLCGARVSKDTRMIKPKSDKELAQERLAAVDAEAKVILESGGVLKSEADSYFIQYGRRFYSLMDSQLVGLDLVPGDFSKAKDEETIINTYSHFARDHMKLIYSAPSESQVYEDEACDSIETTCKLTPTMFQGYWTPANSTEGETFVAFGSENCPFDHSKDTSLVRMWADHLPLASADADKETEASSTASTSKSTKQRSKKQKTAKTAKTGKALPHYVYTDKDRSMRDQICSYTMARAMSGTSKALFQRLFLGDEYDKYGTRISTDKAKAKPPETTEDGAPNTKAIEDWKRHRENLSEALQKFAMLFPKTVAPAVGKKGQVYNVEALIEDLKEKMESDPEFDLLDYEPDPSIEMKFAGDRWVTLVAPDGTEELVIDEHFDDVRGTDIEHLYAPQLVFMADIVSEKGHGCPGHDLTGLHSHQLLRAVPPQVVRDLCEWIKPENLDLEDRFPWLANLHKERKLKSMDCEAHWQRETQDLEKQFGPLVDTDNLCLNQDYVAELKSGNCYFSIPTIAHPLGFNEVNEADDDDDEDAEDADDANGTNGTKLVMLKYNSSESRNISTIVKIEDVVDAEIPKQMELKAQFDFILNRIMRRNVGKSDNEESEKIKSLTRENAQLTSKVNCMTMELNDFKREYAHLKDIESRYLQMVKNKPYLIGEGRGDSDRFVSVPKAPMFSGHFSDLHTKCHISDNRKVQIGLKGTEAEVEIFFLEQGEHEGNNVNMVYSWGQAPFTGVGEGASRFRLRFSNDPTE